MPLSPTISLVTPSFNQAVYIERTIQSVLAQSHRPVEYLVLDGGSADGTVDILKRYASGGGLRFTSQKDGGQADAIHRGFLQCTSDVISWLNSDDFYPHADVLKKVSDTFSDPAVDIVYADGELVGPTGLPFRASPAARIREPKDLLIRPVGFALQPSVFFRRQLYLDAGGIQTRYYAAFDYDLWLRLFAKARKWIYLPETLSHATCHPDAKSIKQMSRLIRELTEIKRGNAPHYNLSFKDRLHMQLHLFGLHAYHLAVRTGVRRAV